MRSFDKFNRYLRTFPYRERHVIAPVTFTFEIKVVFDFFFSFEEIERITFCTTDLGIFGSQDVSSFIEVANQFTVVLYAVIG